MYHKLPHFPYVAVKREVLGSAVCGPDSGLGAGRMVEGFGQCFCACNGIFDREEERFPRLSERLGHAPAPGCHHGHPGERALEQHQAKGFFPGRGYDQHVGALQEPAHARLVQRPEQLDLLRDPQLGRKRVQLRTHRGLARPSQKEPRAYTVRGSELGQRAVGHGRALLPFHPPHEGDCGLLSGVTLQAGPALWLRDARVDRRLEGGNQRVREAGGPARRVAVPADRRLRRSESINLK